jgi:putative MFS transporter
MGAVYNVVLGLYGAELFPTNLRATASAGVWGIGRVVSTFVPVVLLALLASQGATGMFAAISAALLASLVLILVAAPLGLARRPVE